MDLFNEIKEQLSSCPAKTRAICRTVQTRVWEAVSSLNETLNFVDNSGGSSGDVGSSSIAAVRTVGSGDGRHYHHTANMGSVKSRALTSADTNLVDENNVVACSSSSNYQQQQHHHNQIKSYCGNGSGFLHKNDLRYDIGGSSQYHPVRQPSIRSRSQQPMPTAEELDRRFTKVLVSGYNVHTSIYLSYVGIKPQLSITRLLK